MAKVPNPTYMRSLAAPILSKRWWNHAICRSNVSHNVTAGRTKLRSPLIISGAQPISLCDWQRCYWCWDWTAVENIEL